MSQYANLNQKLKNIFQIDRPDLDFGIYRILNARRKEINDYLDHRLKSKVEYYLEDAKGHVQGSQLESLTNQIKDEFGKRAFDEAGNLINDDAIESALGRQYQALRDHSDSSFDQAQVFSHLYTFFSRYYDEGDFISQRRYKGDTYAIPYSGEEVMLHWANKDQYYTKSGEMFSNYRIRFNSIGEPNKAVLFRLLSADTAKDNQKDNDKSRRFVILSKPKTITRTDDDGEEYEETIHPIEINDDKDELTVWFEYAALDKKEKQDRLNVQAHGEILKSPVVTSSWHSLLTHPAPTEKNTDRDLLLKHIDAYTQKNTADYFIHKDLGKFLNNELDFYIKNEVMHLDDVVNSSGFMEIERQLALIKCLRMIGRELIDFLASLENFQKKLWLKKKFVVSSHYCITLDRVDDALYNDIADNDAQWQQWESLGFKLNDDSLSDWGSTQYLVGHPYLMVDTSLFDLEFKAKLLNTISDLDEQTDGVIFHSDNFQALQIIQYKFDNKIDTLYYDPPYNTSESSFLYKNNFKESSWLTMIQNRLEGSKSILNDNGIINICIDDFEYSKLQNAMDDIFGCENRLGNLVIEIKPSGRTNDNYLATSHEYSLIYAKDIAKSTSVNFIELNDEQRSAYKFKDDQGSYKWRDFMRTGGYSTPSERPNSFYPIYFNQNENKISIKKLNEDFIEILPIDSTSNFRVWRKTPPSLQKHIDKGEIRVVKRSSGSFKVEIIDRIKSGIRPKSVWVDSKYDASSHGTKLIKKIVPDSNFSFPKSFFTTLKNLELSVANNLNAFIVDIFAGSGTTAHATIELNRDDGGQRKYILVEQGEYFDTVLKPRIQKVVYSQDWKNGSPTLSKDKANDDANLYNGISHCLKVVKLESYEDTLNNLELKRSQAQSDLFDDLTPDQQDDYLMHYMLDIESKNSLLSVKDFANPFDYQLKIATDSAGAYSVQNIDLIDTFNYLIGLNVESIDYQLAKGYVQVVGHLRTGEFVTVFWRDCDQLNREGLNQTLDKLSINPNDKEYHYIYVNGDHHINSKMTTNAEGNREIKVRSIEQVFLDRMFSE